MPHPVTASGASGPLVSAHRCGAGADRRLENSRAAIELAAGLGVEYVEFDVQRTSDGVFVLFHDDHVALGAGDPVRLDEVPFAALPVRPEPLLRYEEALAIISSAGCRAHIDLKFTSPRDRYADPGSTYEVDAARMAVHRLGVDAVVLTSLEDESVRAIRTWARSACPELLVGLSLGRDMTGRRRREVVRTRFAELFPRTRIRESEANVVVANQRLARLTLARFAARRALPLLVWTVDDPRALRRWLADPRVWLLTTNHPSVAVGVRAAVAGKRRSLRRGRGTAST